jgi:hypothetical protein
VVRTRIELVNQHDRAVMTQVMTNLILRRPDAEAPGAEWRPAPPRRTAD